MRDEPEVFIPRGQRHERPIRQEPAVASRSVTVTVKDVPEVVAEIRRLTAERDAARAIAVELEQETAQLRAKLELPCGSCRPCANWADETWRRAGMKPPTVGRWEELRATLGEAWAALDRVRALAVQARAEHQALADLLAAAPRTGPAGEPR